MKWNLLLWSRKRDEVELNRTPIGTLFHLMKELNFNTRPGGSFQCLIMEAKKREERIETSFTYRNQEAANFGEGVGDTGMSFSWRCKRLYLDVEIFWQMRVFVFTAQSEFFLLNTNREQEKGRWRGNDKALASEPFFFLLVKTLTFFLSRIEPRPNTDILHIVSSCNRFRELPFGPNSFPTKLNCKSQFQEEQ